MNRTQLGRLYRKAAKEIYRRNDFSCIVVRELGELAATRSGDGKL